MPCSFFNLFFTCHILHLQFYSHIVPGVGSMYMEYTEYDQYEIDTELHRKCCIYYHRYHLRVYASIFLLKGLFPICMPSASFNSRSTYLFVLFVCGGSVTSGHLITPSSLVSFSLVGVNPIQTVEHCEVEFHAISIIPLCNQHSLESPSPSLAPRYTIHTKCAPRAILTKIHFSHPRTTIDQPRSCHCAGGVSSVSCESLGSRDEQSQIVGKPGGVGGGGRGG